MVTIANDVPSSRKGQYLQQTLHVLAASPEGASPRAVFDVVKKNLDVSGVACK
jgi:hypothetical protein